ncbi:MAG: cytochrome c, partial [Saprospiraceae bacterium]|nr:cytochrome c [Saprospiraceae bacterium]
MYVSCRTDPIDSVSAPPILPPQSHADSVFSEPRYPANWPVSFSFGDIASKEDIERWDIDIMPDGTGLPEGSGNTEDGQVIYRMKCMVCHGQKGVEGPFDKLVGREPNDGFPFGKDVKYQSMRTIGNYWPYATTLFDYIRRSMPQNQPGSLSAQEVYALCAYLLYLNEIVPQGTTMSAETLPKVKMPARDRFVRDNR